MRRVVIALALLLPSVLAPAGCVYRLAELDMSDAGIKARVQAELKSHPDVDVRYMEVNVHVRVVYLSGVVTNPQQKRRIAQIARRVPGVRHVIVNLLVQE